MSPACAAAVASGRLISRAAGCPTPLSVAGFVTPSETPHICIAGFKTCCIAEIQIGGALGFSQHSASASAYQVCPAPAGVRHSRLESLALHETREISGQEAVGTRLFSGKNHSKTHADLEPHFSPYTPFQQTLSTISCIHASANSVRTLCLKCWYIHFMRLWAAASPAVSVALARATNLLGWARTSPAHSKTPRDVPPRSQVRARRAPTTTSTCAWLVPQQIQTDHDRGQNRNQNLYGDSIRISRNKVSRPAASGSSSRCVHNSAATKHNPVAA